jgi:hypothetical protein
LIVAVVFFAILLIAPFANITPLQELPKVENVNITDVLLRKDGLEWLVKTEANDYLFNTNASPIVKAFKVAAFKNPDRCEPSHIKLFSDSTAVTSYYFAYGGPQQETAETVLSKEEDNALATIGFVADNRNYGGGGWGPRPLFRSWTAELKGKQLASNSVNTSQFVSIQDSCYMTTNKIETYLPEAKEKFNRQINQTFINPWNDLVGTFNMPFVLLLYFL